jgi:hypothetical protein
MRFAVCGFAGEKLRSGQFGNSRLLKQLRVELHKTPLRPFHLVSPLCPPRLSLFAMPRNVRDGQSWNGGGEIDSGHHVVE